MKVVVLIPAHNEAGLIGATVGAAREIPGVSQVIVINDGSTDNTAAIAAGAGAVVVDMPRNAGKGAALTAGWQHAPAGGPAGRRLCRRFRGRDLSYTPCDLGWVSRPRGGSTHEAQAHRPRPEGLLAPRAAVTAHY